ncbi:MAG: hypothetical protein K1W06_10825 [Lachnospiraceae bacterium]
MKENLIRALGYAIMVIIGMVIVELASGNGISFQYVIIAGIIAGIVDYIFSAVSNRIKSRKSR